MVLPRLSCFQYDFICWGKYLEMSLLLHVYESTYPLVGESEYNWILASLILSCFLTCIIM